mgnify:CR=1 FL=1
MEDHSLEKKYNKYIVAVSIVIPVVVAILFGIKLKDFGINARRYFYPLISDFPMYRGLTSSNTSNLPVATTASKQVLCLPIFPTLMETSQMKIIELIRNI